MSQYSDESVNIFLKEQGKLFDEPVASDSDEARQFLEDCMAQEFDNFKEMKEYFEEEGMDTQGMSDDEIADSLEVFKLSNGRFLVVEA